MIDKLEIEFDEEAEKAIEKEEEEEGKMSEEDYPINSKLSPQKQLEVLSQVIINLLNYNDDLDQHTGKPFYSKDELYDHIDEMQLKLDKL